MPRTIETHPCLRCGKCCKSAPCCAIPFNEAKYDEHGNHVCPHLFKEPDGIYSCEFYKNETYTPSGICTSSKSGPYNK